MVQLNSRSKANIIKWKTSRQDHSTHKFRKLKEHRSKEELKTIIQRL
jgi:hypothetical protein